MEQRAPIGTCFTWSDDSGFQRLGVERLPSTEPFGR